MILSAQPNTIEAEKLIILTYVQLQHPVNETGTISDISDEDSDKEYLLLGITPNDLQKAAPVAQTLSADEARQILIDFVEDYA
jgi:hypothetical protein